MKQILMVLASKRFRDIEYLVPRAFFERAGFKVYTASSAKVSTGRFGYEVTNDFLIEEIKPEDFNGLFLVGGAGAIEYLENIHLKNIFVKTHLKGKPVAAICAAPRNFLNWDMLRGQDVTGHNGDGTFVEFAKAKGAIPHPEKTVIVHNGILTANGPEAAEESALRFMEMINEIN